MKIVLFGTGSFGAAVATQIDRRSGHELVGVVSKPGDKLYRVAEASDRLVGRIPKGTDIIVAAHWTEYIDQSTREDTSYGAMVGHPSLLPRHRGIDAVRWTIKERDPIAGFTWFLADDGLDTGQIVYQDWCHVHPDWDASALWREALFPMGVGTILMALDSLEVSGPYDQDERFATAAPRLEHDPA